MIVKNILIKDFEEASNLNFPFERFSDKVFFVTGSTGLVCSILIKFLLFLNVKFKLNIHVVAVIRNIHKANKIYSDYLEDSSLEFLIVDLEKDELFYGDEVDYIVHGAAITKSKIMVDNPVKTIDLALNGTKKVLELARIKKIKSMVYLSSMEVYGQPQKDGKISENDLGYVDLSNVRSCYPEGKRMCECLCTAYFTQFNVNVVSARLAQTFGAGTLATENRVFAQFIKNGLRNKNIVLHTSGKSEGNYIYTTDAIIAILTLLLKGKSGEAYNVSNEQSHISIIDMAKLVASDIFANKISVVVDKRDQKSFGYAPDVKMWLDNTKMQALGWKANVSLIESYRRLLAWMKDNNSC